MGQLTTIKDASDEILATQEEFELISGNILNFRKEYQFAIQSLEKNSFTLQTALRNPQSLKNAIINISAIGLSLNPAERLAYLVPRDSAIHLDISYIGLLKLAVMDGSVLWGQANVVKKNDRFTLRGFGEEPIHDHDPFSDRGEAVGVFCVVKTCDGSYLTTTMTIQECLDIRDRTQIWQKSKTGPWKSDQEAMCLKTVIKRASKLWPKGSNARLEKAIEVINEHEGIDFNQSKESRKVSSASNALNAQLAQVKPECKEIIDSIKKLCGGLCEGFTEDQKRAFIKNDMQLESFAELNLKDVAFLKELEFYLVERFEKQKEDIEI
jgi:recombination protein RecT